jgi:hypothetical protein
MEVPLPRRRERILGFDRLNGIEIADLADRLMEVWPGDRPDPDDVAQARACIDTLEHSVSQLAAIVDDLRAELERVERGEASR